MNKKIIIIGAGVSGLSCGIFAQKCGFETEIYEKTHFSGGNLTGWKRKDCYIDNCIHWLVGSKNGTNFYKLWEEVGAFKNLNLYQSEDFIVSEYNNQRISLNKDINVTYENMLKVSIEDKKEIKKFITATKLISNLENQTRLGKIASILKIYSIYKKQTIKEVASKFKCELLKKLLTDYIIEEYSIYSLLCAYSSFSSGDGKVIKEGSLQMAKNITQKYLSLGGKINYCSAVKEIITENKKAIGVKLENGKVIFSDIIVCCTDPKVAFNELLKLKMPKTLSDCYKNKKYFPVVSSFHIAFGVNEQIEIPETFVFETNKVIKIGVTEYSRIMLKSYNYNKNFTKGDGFVLQVFLLQRETDYNKWASFSEDEYIKEKERIVNEITMEIKNKYNLQNLDYLDCWTPLTYTKYFNAYKGSYMSFGITKKLALKIYPYSCKNIKNLYFASQWQKMFGGLPNALINGKQCVTEIIKNNKIKPV